MHDKEVADTLAAINAGIKMGRSEADAAYLEGVKAGLDAAAEAVRTAAHPEFVSSTGVTPAGHFFAGANAMAGSIDFSLSRLDPTTITRKGGADE